MTWTGQTFSVGQVLTAAQMTNLQADITAAFDKDAGAPVLANNYVTQAMIDSSAVGQGELKSAESTTSTKSATIRKGGVAPMVTGRV